ncbi:pantetheine-phosphate adenylyltransferase [Blochmannia endosymbiont of Colobopsis nipponica]|uniref:pantetheine-phosphate adenylyltransferase n=1 Tax=Blochmannia endosymbiont of Colobopsis nipponica TaxID=2681987 RepID=UPI00178008CF|nr:pantetheine-phosphate adenylyltransferase [Blochmannia endosymbiont of Colobopsis nipponica]QOI10863.1 pantetheine-phosphate adenylyltransferase [Blochmannia endosymbiont of Colobopsis nipponica]
MIKAIYPGTFDPLTNGHLDLLTRTEKIFDLVILAITNNPQKKTLFNINERVTMATQATKHLTKVSISSVDGLIVNFAKEKKINILIRGLRTIADFELEIQLARINRHLNPEIESIFMLTNERYSYLSSSIIKELATHGCNLNNFLPKYIATAVIEKIKTTKYTSKNKHNKIIYPKTNHD